MGGTGICDATGGSGTTTSPLCSAQDSIKLFRAICVGHADAKLRTHSSDIESLFLK